MKRLIITLLMVTLFTFNLIVVYQIYAGDHHYPVMCCEKLNPNRKECDEPPSGPWTCSDIEECPVQSENYLLGNCIEDGVDSQCFYFGEWHTKMECPPDTTGGGPERL